MDNVKKQACYDAVRAKVGPKYAISDVQLDRIIDEVENRVLSRRSAGSLENVEDSIFRAMSDVVGEIRTSAILEQRKTALNILRRQELHGRIAGFSDSVKGIKAVMVGLEDGTPGSRMSVDAAHKALARQFEGMMLADLRRANLLEVFNSNTLEREIARELWEIRPDGAPGITRSKEAQEIAGIISKHQKIALERLNRAGAYVKELKGYIVRQSHDFKKISSAGFDQWVDYLGDKLDLEKTIGVTDKPREALEETYWSLLKGGQKDIPEDQLISLHGGDIARQASAHRELHFRSADAWLDYNKRFGSRSLGESVFGGMNDAARNIAMLETFGPEPEAMFKTILKDLIDKSKDPKEIEKLKDALSGRGMIRNFFEEITGQTSNSASNMLAKVGRGWRALNTLSKLGLATISSITDVATKAAELKYQGIGFLEGYAKSIADVFKGRGSGWTREFADSLGLGFEGALGEIHSRFTTTEDLPGAMSKAMQLFFKWNGMSWWTDTLKTGAGLIMANNLAKKSGMAWGEIGEELQRVLSAYGIEEKRWGLAKSLVATGEDGRQYLDPALVRSLLPDQIKQVFDAPKAREREVRRLQDQLETAFRAYITDRVDYAVITPGAKEQAYLRLGTKAGTPEGEAIRLLMQFKSFTVTGMTKGLGRAFVGKGGKLDVVGLAHLMVATTALGYVAMSAKDLVKGKTPRDAASPKTWAAAFTQGGGAGIYGDFVFGDLSRFGTSALASVTGPAAGQFESIVELWQKWRSGDDAAAQTVRFVVNNTPFINLPYTRMALDYLFLYGLSEKMNPGYLRRMERRTEKENGQVYLMPPSRHANKF